MIKRGSSAATTDAKLQRLPFDIERDRQRADLGGGENDLQMLDAIAHRQRHAVAALDADGKQPMREPIHPRIELGISGLAKPVPRRDLERKLPSVTAQAVAH